MNKWGAVMAYRVGMIQSVGDNKYGTNAISDYPYSGIGNWAYMHQYGRIGEYSVAGGFNINNFLYFGFSVGIQDIYYNQTTLYEEYYIANDSAPDPADGLMYDQYLRASGYGINFKFGVTLRPTDALRIGVAVHTPTFVNIDTTYDAEFTSFYPNDGVHYYDSYFTEYYDLRFSDKFRTPTRLLTGISYTFGDRGLISADYEVDFYKGIRLAGDIDYSTDQYYKDAVRNDFKTGHVFRIGGEYKPTQRVALRAGFGYYGSVLQDNNAVFDDPVAYRGYNISGGLGFWLAPDITLDLAYVYMKNDYTKYDLYYYNYYDNAGNPLEIGSGLITQKRHRHNAVLSLNFRF